MGLLFKIPAIVISLVAGVWGFFLCMAIVTDNLGFIGGAIAFMFFPVALAFAPWYAVIASGNWFPRLLVYGGGLGAALLYGMGAAIDGD